MWHQQSSLTMSHGHCLSHKGIVVSSGLPRKKSLAFAISPVSPTACLDCVEATKREASLRQGYLSGEQGPGLSFLLALPLEGSQTPMWRTESGLVAVSVVPST